MHNANVQQRTQTRSTHKPHTASFDFAHFTFTACPQTEKQAYLWLFRSSSTLQQQEKMSWSLILVSSNRIGIKMWHFTTPVLVNVLLPCYCCVSDGHSLFKCKFVFERSCTAVPSAALTVYCLLLSESIRILHSNVVRYNVGIIHTSKS